MKNPVHDISHSRLAENFVHYMGDKNLVLFCFFINLGVIPLEIWGGYISGSFSLMSDGIHMISHLLILMLSYFAVTQKKHIAGAVFINGIFLIGLSIFMFCSAFYRLFSPVEILSVKMFIIALVGLSMDFLQNVFLHHPAEDNHGLIMESVFEHNLSDLFLSLCVVIGSLCIYASDRFPVFPGFYVDILLLFVFAPIIFLKGVKLVKKSYAN